jgi:putative nucleotidyltransferase with HDIG domain
VLLRRRQSHSLNAAHAPSSTGRRYGGAARIRLAARRMRTSRSSWGAARRLRAALATLSEQAAALEQHVERVGTLAAALAAALGLPEHEARRIGLAGSLHDIGKTAIPTAILDKPGPLDEQEWEWMRQHTVIGAQMVLSAPGLAETAPLIRSSHERVDGTGYPDGLRCSNIPLGSRIIAVCDAFDALTTDRVYRRAIGTQAALDELARHAGTQFDAAVVMALANLPGLSDVTPHRLACEPVGANALAFAT